MGRGISITYKGKHYPSIRQFALAYGQNPMTVYFRYLKGWDLDSCISTEKLEKIGIRVKIDGQEFKSLSHAAKHYGISRATLDKRLNVSFWSLEKALKTPLLRVRR